MLTTFATRSDFYRAKQQGWMTEYEPTIDEIESSAVDYMRDYLKRHEVECTILTGCTCQEMRAELGRLLWKKEIEKLLV